jgi:coatomer subunit zeta
MSDLSVPIIHSVVILDQDGSRMLAKYYDGQSKGEQIKNEINLHKKCRNMATKNGDAEIIPVDHEVIVFRSGADCKFFLAGPADENELILVAVMDAIYEALSGLLKGQIDKGTIFDNLELVLLTLDEVIDQGHIVETDPNAVISRVLMRGNSSNNADSGMSESGGSRGGQETAVGDMTISQALGLARDQFMKSLISGTTG